MSKLWALDFGDKIVTAIVAEVGPGLELRLLGGGDVPAQGLRAGQFSNAGDATECVVEALRKAEKASGLKCERLFFNFDDASLETALPVGSRTLTGEGQIRNSDVQQAVHSALRQVGHFEKSVVHSSETYFLIDGKDAVMNPVGVFGRQLDVGLMVLLAKAQHLETWHRVIERAHLKGGTPVLSALSSVFGVLTPQERQGKRIVWDLGGDLLNGVVYDREVLRALRCHASVSMSVGEIVETVTADSKRWASEEKGIQEVVLTGDLSEREALVERLRTSLGMETRVAAPESAPLDKPRFASTAGILRAARKIRARGSAETASNGLMGGIRQKAVALLNEYF